MNRPISRIMINELLSEYSNTEPVRTELVIKLIAELGGDVSVLQNRSERDVLFYILLLLCLRLSTQYS